uniref:Nicastrin n=1 Tax=Rhizophora mucronata TaxID=61149 RepID=A0A2P2M6L0_RHIMU
MAMASNLSSLLLLLFFNLSFRFSFSGQTNSMESVPDLQKSMYLVVDGYPCVRLLSLSGEIGCANPGRDKVVAPIVRFRKAHELACPSAIFVSLDELQEVLDRYVFLLIF